MTKYMAPEQKAILILVDQDWRMIEVTVKAVILEFQKDRQLLSYRVADSTGTEFEPDPDHLFPSWQAAAAECSQYISQLQARLEGDE